MADQSKAKFFAAAIVVAPLLVLSGLSLTGTVIALIVATPVLVLFSPVLVPAGIVLFMVISGLFFSYGCGMAAMMTLFWTYSYVSGKHPPGSDQVDYARERLAAKAKEYQQYAQQKAQEATQAQGA